MKATFVIFSAILFLQGSAHGRLVEYHLRISEQKMAPAGKENNAVRINGGISGPIGVDIHVIQGRFPMQIVYSEKKGAFWVENSLAAKVGDSLPFVHSQANLQTVPHLVGVGGHHVRERGNIEDPPARDLEVWVNVSGSVGDFKYTFQQLGTYIYRSHNLIEAFMLSSVSEIKVELERDNDLMEQVKKPSPIK